MVETRSMKLKRRSWKYNFPIDLDYEILLRLPVKSLVRFRSVSKTWRAWIHDPKFARLHLNHSYKSRHDSQIYVPQSRELNVRCSKTFKLNAHIPPAENLDNARWHIIDSIDGLFMIRFDYDVISDEGRLMLWNPSIRKVTILPPCPQTKRGPFQYIDVGLGFDPSINDYKYLKFEVNSKSCMVVCSVWVYTFGTNTWKANLIKGCPNDWQWNPVRRKSVCFRGALYFLPMRSTQVVSYDLSCEKEGFTYSNLPADANPNPKCNYPCALTLANDGSSLALVSFNLTQGWIWLAKDFKADITWSKHYTFASKIPDTSSLRTHRGFLYLNADEVMLLEWENLVISYNLKTHKEKIVQVKEIDQYLNLAGICPYVESLMLLNL